MHIYPYIYIPVYIYIIYTPIIYIYTPIYIYTRIHSGERWEYRVLERYLHWPRKIHIVCWYWRFVIVSMGPSYFFGFTIWFLIPCRVLNWLHPYAYQSIVLITKDVLRDFPATFDTGGYLQWWYLFSDYQAIESQKVDVSPGDFN